MSEFRCGHLAFPSPSLPKPSWKHGAHVAVAAHLAFDHAPEVALDLTRAGILHFDTCVGTPNTEDNGYHETLTRFWSDQVGKPVRGGRFASRLEAVRHTIHLFGEDRDRRRPEHPEPQCGRRPTLFARRRSI
jgi:hypothetical protein